MMSIVDVRLLVGQCCMMGPLLRWKPGRVKPWFPH